MAWDPEPLPQARQPGDCAQDFATITKDHTDVFEVVIGQVREDSEVDPVLGKALGILRHAELREPLLYLLHHRPAPG